MGIKIITVILYIGIITQTFAFDAYTIETIRECSPLLLFPLAPFIFAAILIIAIKILAYGGKLILDLFKYEEE